MYTFNTKYATVYTSHNGVTNITVILSTMANEFINDLKGDFYGVGGIDEPQHIHDGYYNNHTKYNKHFITNVKKTS